MKRIETDTYESSAFATLKEAVDAFLSTQGATVKKACFGVPGPVVDGAARTTNLSWEVKKEDPSAVIATGGQSGQFEIYVKTMDIFASILGAQAGNLVLTLLATGGLYLGGGIPPKISKELVEGETVAAYLNKGRLSYLVEKTPLHVILDNQAALLRAASLASSL